jgi:hypothetical protein
MSLLDSILWQQKGKRSQQRKIARPLLRETCRTYSQGNRLIRDAFVTSATFARIIMTNLGSMTIATAPVIRALDETVLTGMTGILFLQWLIGTFSRVREGRPLEKLTRRVSARFTEYGRQKEKTRQRDISASSAKEGTRRQRRVQVRNLHLRREDQTRTGSITTV